MATIQKRGDSWFVQVRRKGYSPRYQTFGTKAEAERWGRQQEALIDQRQAPTDHRSLNATLGEVLNRYLTDVTPRKRSAETERLRIRKLAKAPMCSLSLADLTPEVVGAYRDERLKVAKPATIRRELAVVQHALDLARKEWGYALLENSVAKVKLPKVRDARDRRLKPCETRRLEDAFAKTRNPLIRPFVLFAVETAMRRGEILSLTWANVDLTSRVAHLPITKNGEARTVPLTDNALAILRALPRTAKEPRVFPLTATAVRLAWNRLRERAGLPDLRLHDLRHEGISRFCEMGLTIPEISVISGHKDPRMLFRYAHLRPTDLAQKLAGRSWANEGAAR